MEDKFGCNNDFYRALDVIPISIYWKDVCGKYLGCNTFMAEMAGLSRENIVGKTDDDLIWKDAAKDIHQIEQSVIKNKAKYEVEEMSFMGGNKKHIFLSTKTPFYDLSGEVIGIIGASIDITERKQAEQLQKEQEVIEKVSYALTLSGCIAHEMRTPLSVILINADNLRAELKNVLAAWHSKKEQRHRIKEFIDNISFSIKNCSAIIDMLLMKLRSMLNKQDHIHRVTSCSMKSCIGYVLGVYPFYNNELDLVRWNDKENEDFTYLGDELWTSHVLFNLMKNALRVIREEEQGNIYISLRCGEKFNYLIFRDTAAGIPPEIFKILFAQFNSGSRGSAGLGLAFCKMVMQSYGGDITCDSKEGKYAEFTLSFPVKQK